MDFILPLLTANRFIVLFFSFKIIIKSLSTLYEVFRKGRCLNVRTPGYQTTPGIKANEIRNTFIPISVPGVLIYPGDI